MAQPPIDAERSVTDQDFVKFPRDSQNWYYYSAVVFKKLASDGPILSRERFDQIKDTGLSQLFLAASSIKPEGWTVDPQKNYPPHHIMRNAHEVNQVGSTIVISPKTGNKFNPDTAEYVARFAAGSEPAVMEAIRNDTNESITFADVYMGLKLADNEGNEIVVYIVNVPINEGNQIDGYNSGVIIEQSISGQSVKAERRFYSFSDSSIETPREVGLYFIHR